MSSFHRRRKGVLWRVSSFAQGHTQEVVKPLNWSVLTPEFSTFPIILQLSPFHCQQSHHHLLCCKDICMAELLPASLYLCCLLVFTSSFPQLFQPFACPNPAPVDLSYCILKRSIKERNSVLGSASSIAFPKSPSFLSSHRNHHNDDYFRTWKVFFHYLRSPGTADRPSM